MSRHASVSAAIATLALSLGALAPTTAVHAATCNAAPKPSAPAGSHWYYRTDRSQGRKCWYLAADGQKGKVVPRPAAADENADAAAAATPAAPMAEAAARLTEPLRSPPPAARPAVDTAIVAQADTNAPILVPTESIRRSDGPAAAPIAQAAAPSVATPGIAQEPSIADQTAPVAAPAPVAAAVADPAPTSGRINLMQFVFVAFVGLCLLAGLFLYLAATRRRRDIRIVDLNTPAQLRMPAALTDSPSVAPDASRRDHLDVERLRRFSHAWKRQPA
jgi:hypothetical protein